MIGIDATLITAHSAEQGATAAFRKGFGFHSLAARYDKWPIRRIAVDRSESKTPPLDD